MNVNEVAAELDVSPITVSNYLAAGKLKGVKVKREGHNVPMWAVTEQDLTAFKLTWKKPKKMKPRQPKKLKVTAAELTGSNGHKQNREPQIRQVIDAWIDGLVESKRIPGLGELTRNDVAALAHRIKRVV